MITPEEKKSLIEIFGNHYSTVVLDYLNAYGITSKEGKELSKNFIVKVFNGKPNKRIEAAIFTAAEEHTSLLNNLFKKRKNILNKKTAAVTAV